MLFFCLNKKKMNLKHEIFLKFKIKVCIMDRDLIYEPMWDPLIYHHPNLKNITIKC